ncbi:MAG: hypothetical protein MJ187_03580 [Alphaproteobacteria bacterium]|nr:hypothetical protein [Alphaproteobacteria bacterium]
MKKILMLCMLLYGCAINADNVISDINKDDSDAHLQMTENERELVKHLVELKHELITLNSESKNGKTIITNISIIDCGLKYQGCWNMGEFINCAYEIKEKVFSLPPQGIKNMENTLHTEYGMKEEFYPKINNAAIIVVNNYLNCVNKLR